MVRLHDGDDVVGRAPLEGMHGGRPCTIQVSELRVPEFEPPPVLKPERDAAPSNRRNLERWTPRFRR